MNVCTTISISTTAGAAVLSGATNGAEWYRRTRERIDLCSPGLFVLDFSDVQIATVSWLREAVVGLSKYAANLKPDVVPVAANLSEAVLEELLVALEATNSVMIVVEVDDAGRPTRPCLLGRLDPALMETLRVVEDRAYFDASAVADAIPSLSASAANNRLAALEDKGILKSVRQGRTRVYRPLIEGLVHGR